MKYHSIADGKIMFVTGILLSKFAINPPLDWATNFKARLKWCVFQEKSIISGPTNASYNIDIVHNRGIVHSI